MVLKLSFNNDSNGVRLFMNLWSPVNVPLGWWTTESSCGTFPLRTWPWSKLFVAISYWHQDDQFLCFCTSMTCKYCRTQHVPALISMPTAGSCCFKLFWTAIFSLFCVNYFTLWHSVFCGTEFIVLLFLCMSSFLPLVGSMYLGWDQGTGTWTLSKPNMIDFTGVKSWLLSANSPVSFPLTLSGIKSFSAPRDFSNVIRTEWIQF